MMDILFAELHAAFQLILMRSCPVPADRIRILFEGGRSLRGKIKEDHRGRMQRRA